MCTHRCCGHYLQTFQGCRHLSPAGFHSCRSIPAFNQDVEKIQRTLEEIAFLLRIPQRKPWGNMASDVQAALASFDNRAVLLAGVPDDKTEEGGFACRTV